MPVSKKNLNFKVKIQEIRTRACNFQNFSFFCKSYPQYFKISWGVCNIHFSSPMLLKGPFITMFVQLLHIFWEKITLNNYFWEILNSGKWQIFSKLIFGDIAMTCINIVWGQKLLNLLKLSSTHISSKQSMNWLFDPADF